MTFKIYIFNFENCYLFPIPTHCT